MSGGRWFCREVRPDDRKALVSLWVRVFGDAPELVEAFLDLLPEMGTGVTAEENGELLGTAYLLDGFTLISPDSAPKKCGYLYAVAVEEHARRKGIGARLSQAAAEIGRMRGAELICTLPAEHSLYRWYASVLSLHEVTQRSFFLRRNTRSGGRRFWQAAVMCASLLRPSVFRRNCACVTAAVFTPWETVSSVPAARRKAGASPSFSVREGIRPSGTVFGRRRGPISAPTCLFRTDASGTSALINRL